MSEKALIAMSGGVDSSVAAFLMKQQGYDCMGATMKLYTGTSLDPDSGSCGNLTDIEDARKVAAFLGMGFDVFDFSGTFRKEVMERFVDAYEHGRTPNPCIDCNRYLKFLQFYRRSQELDFDYIVTGHYAFVKKEGDRYHLKRALDPSKDQSYVLYSLNQEQLAHTIFPLGAYHKSEIREIAEREGLLNAHKKDSQDICFVKGCTYGDFIESFTGKQYPEGDFIDTEGNVLGRHKGIIRYTIGQRKGLGIALGEPHFVTKVDPITNTVTLGKNEDLFSKELTADHINLIPCDTLTGRTRLQARIRYQAKEQWATVEQIGDDRIHLEFDEPQRAITSGQAVVLYDGDEVVGGGTIL